MVGGLNAPPAPFVPEQHQLEPGYAALVVGTGTAESHAEVFDALRSVPVLFDFATPMPYVELQKMLDEANAWGFHCYDKGCYVETLSDDVIDAVTDQLPEEDLSTVAGAVLPARWRLLARRRGCDGVQRWTVPSFRRFRDRSLSGPRDARCGA